MTASVRDVAKLAQVSLGTVSNVINHPEIVAKSTLLKVQLAMQDLGFNQNVSVFRDVAKLAQVSLGTVSNVINHPEIVAKSTLLKVQLAMQDLGFNQNVSVKQSRKNKSRTIALLVPDISNLFYTEISRGIQDCAAKYEYLLIIANHDDSIESETRHFKMFAEQGVRGVLVRPAGNRDEHVSDIFANISMVTIMESDSPSGQYCSATVDGTRGGEIAIQHLFDLGHTNITYVSGPASIPQFSLRGAGAYQRSHQLGVNLRTIEVETPTIKSGEDAAALFLKSAVRSSAIFCGNDMLALGVLSALTRAGVRVPLDVSVMGFDDIEFSANTSIPLTTIAQSTYQLGYAAAELLIQECEQSVLHAHQQIIFQPQLVTRQSTAPFLSLAEISSESA